MIGELSANDIELMLHREIVARLGCHADGRTYVVPITYAYDGSSLISHAAEGRKIWMMRANRRVCVEIDRVEAPRQWSSVIAWGEYQELSGAEAAAALDVLKARFQAVSTSESALPPPGQVASESGRKKAVVFRIRLDEKTGRAERP